MRYAVAQTIYQTTLIGIGRIENKTKDRKSAITNFFFGQQSQTS